jgi:hypothetical protein
VDTSLTEETAKWYALVNTVLNVLVSQRQEISSAAGGICHLTDAATWSL